MMEFEFINDPEECVRSLFHPELPCALCGRKDFMYRSFHPGPVLTVNAYGITPHRGKATVAQLEARLAGTPLGEVEMYQVYGDSDGLTKWTGTRIQGYVNTGDG